MIEDQSVGRTGEVGTSWHQQDYLGANRASYRIGPISVRVCIVLFGRTRQRASCRPGFYTAAASISSGAAVYEWHYACPHHNPDGTCRFSILAANYSATMWQMHRSFSRSNQWGHSRYRFTIFGSLPWLGRSLTW